MQGRRSQLDRKTQPKPTTNGKQHKVSNKSKKIRKNDNNNHHSQVVNGHTKAPSQLHSQTVESINLNGNYNLRQKKHKNYLDYGSDQGRDENDLDFGIKQLKDKSDSEIDIKETIEYDKLPRNIAALEKLRIKANACVDALKLDWFKEQSEIAGLLSSVPDGAIPICADVVGFDWKKLIKEQLRTAGKLFDVIMMDPPWQLSTSQPSRGVAIAYSSLKDDLLQKMPIEQLQDEGFIFVWAINAKYRTALKMMQQWGYDVIDEIIWIKRTVNGKIAKGHGFYLQHAKENCLVGYKGKNIPQRFVGQDIIWSERRGQSQKPQEIYELIEQLVPNGHYLEIFGRRNNLRDKWVTIGNEI